jgi:hypothetical protein
MCRPFHHPLIITCKNIRRMFERVTYSRFSTRSVITTGIACMLLAYGSLQAQTPGVANGNYTILIRGYYTGEGTATVSGGFVSINDVAVRDNAGRSGTLSAASLGLVGDHFGGAATVMGMTITVSGRVDAADPTVANAAVNPDAIVTDARIGATFVDPHGHAGRVVGTKQKPAPGATTTP